MQNKFGHEIELLAPAGSIGRLTTAFHFGADAVYLGGKEFGLRAGSPNFNEQEITAAVKYAHNIGKKVYVTVNIFAKDADFPAIIKYAKFLETAGADAVIVSDLGVLKVIRDNTKLEIHVSTQANITNKYTAMQYAELGASRIILAREVPIADIAEICEYLNGKAAVEVFVHGAMCISYSGRCLLSNYLTGRESNRGDCAQPCRYKYALVEEKRAGEYHPVECDTHGTYILNSRDLCLIDHIKELADAGVASCKIEGRMKSEYYVGGTVNAYRRKMNGEKFNTAAELEKLPHRPFTTGFTFGDKNKEFTESTRQTQTYEVIALSLGENKVRQKNYFAAGDEAEILSPTATFNKTFIIDEIYDTDGNKMPTAKTPEQIIQISCPFTLAPGDILRKKSRSVH